MPIRMGSYNPINPWILPVIVMARYEPPTKATSDGSNGEQQAAGSVVATTVAARLPKFPLVLLLIIAAYISITREAESNTENISDAVTE